MDPIEAKMSKSKPSSAVYLHDSPEDISKKIKDAFCPPEIEGNPVIDIMKLVVFPRLGSVKIDRPVKFGGPVEFQSFDELSNAYTTGKLHPQDLKKGTADSLILITEPVRSYFAKHPQNLEKVRQFSVTR
jgi:tyrosyl-tRNA synthetase